MWSTSHRVRKTVVWQGREIEIEHFDDQDHEPPWENDDLHAIQCDFGRGVVSDWTTRKKKPGEVVLIRDHQSHRFYDWQATTAKAKKYGWGLDIDKYMGLMCKLRRVPTNTQVIREAIQRDFDFVRGWCNDDWNYIGVVVTDVETGVKESVWGIESCCTDYIKEVENELCEQVYMPAVTALILGRVA